MYLNYFSFKFHIFRYGFKKTFKYNQIEEWLRSNINEWPVLCKPKIQTKESVTTPKSSFPFTVEVILEEEQNSLDKKLDFSPNISRNTDTHSDAANVLNSSGIS